MSTTLLDHPNEEALTAFALNEVTGNAERHVSECPSCARFVKEVRMARAAVEELPDEEISAELRQRILSHRCVRGKETHVSLWGQASEWYHSPLIIGLGVAMSAIFLYIFFVFVL